MGDRNVRLTRGLSGQILDVHLDRRVPRLEPREPRVDPPPPRADEVDEEREIVDARVALGEQLALEPFQAPDRLVQETADLPCEFRSTNMPRG